MSRRELALALVCLGTLSIQAQSVSATPTAVSDAIPVDRGWLGVENPGEFHRVAGLEWLVVAPGASLGNSLRIGAWTYAPLPPGRSPKEVAFAAACGASFQRHMKETMKGANYRIGEVLWTARVMDVDEASRKVTVDMKGTDPITTRFLFAFRCILKPEERKDFTPTEFESAFKDLGKLFKQGALDRYASGTKVEIPLAGTVAAATVPKPPARLLDEGLLDPQWFSSDPPPAFHKAKEIDYLWVKPGFDLRGKSLRLSAWEVAPLPPKRDEKDEDKARELVEEMPGLLQKALSDVVGEALKISATEGEFTLSGRWVDQRDGSSFVPPREVFDLKIMDAHGELMVAVHHTCGFGYASLAVKKWAKEFGLYIKGGLSETYAQSPNALTP